MCGGHADFDGGGGADGASHNTLNLNPKQDTPIPIVEAVPIEQATPLSDNQTAAAAEEPQPAAEGSEASDGGGGGGGSCLQLLRLWRCRPRS